MNIYTKASKHIIHSNQASIEAKKVIRDNGVTLMKALEKVCKEDKQMSNLKSKVVEIKKIVEGV